MNTLTKYYGFSTAFAVFAVGLAFVLWGPAAAFTVMVLGILEISLSFDNAVVNARVLNNWDEQWRRRFLFWGILVAVFGMRVIFPIAIVSVTTGIAPFYLPGVFGDTNILSMALNDPETYASHLSEVHHEVAGFGGAFLLMVAFSYFFEEKQVYWWEVIESRLTKFGQLESVAAGIVLIILAGVSTQFADPVHGSQFFWAGVMGTVTFIFAHGLGSLLGASDDEDGADKDNPLAPAIIKQGLAGFVYLEILDASFSFDGVIGAFVLSNYLPIIALGLGIGAFFVRSMTIHLVDGGTLAEYRFLEHGAFYAILALAVIMFGSGLGHELPEWVTGLLSAVILVAAVLHSIVVNRREAGAAPAS